MTATFRERYQFICYIPEEVDDERPNAPLRTSYLSSLFSKESKCSLTGLPELAVCLCWLSDQVVIGFGRKKQAQWTAHLQCYVNRNRI